MSSRRVAGLTGKARRGKETTMTQKTGPITFRATLELGGKTATGITVPPAVVEKLGSHKRPPVTVTLGGHTYRSTVAVMGGTFKFPVSAEHREAAGVSAGDEVKVTLELDSKPRVVEAPADLAAALAAEPRARAAFEALPNSRKKWFVSNVEGAKTETTRAKRIAKAVETLSEG
jgi:hypothetical protein